MFLFKCCQEFHTGIGYELKTEKGTEFCNTLKQIDPKQFTSQKSAIRKIKRSEYKEVYEELKNGKKKFIDQEFPAQEQSLGDIKGIQYYQWKRIPQIISNPVLIGPRVEPHHVVQGALQDCYFLSALAALAENDSMIRNMLDGQSYNSSGIYKVMMRIHGQLQEILVDDFIPVNEDGQPFFCQPFRNQFWMLILEKAWAKVHKSYSNIIMGTPTQVFKALTLAPADLFVVKQKNQEKQKIWNWITNYTAEGFPMVCTAKDNIEKAQIQPGHAYSLIGSALLEDFEGNHHKVVKLRDPWSKQMWQGGTSAQNRQFWSKIISSHELKQFQNKHQSNQTGIISISFNSFCQNFLHVHYCFLQRKPSYNSQPLFVNKKNGSIFEFKVPKPGKYSFQLHQSQIQESIVGHEQQDSQYEGPCRSTMLLIRRTNEGPQFVNGILKYSEDDVVLAQNLEPGNYLLFAKLDPTRSKQLIPDKTIISCYSPCFTMLDNVQKSKHPNLLRKTFLAHARNNKKNQYNNGLMWISWKLILQQGGYAYVAMGVDSQSNKKFVIDFSEDQFKLMNFKLKGEHKNKGQQRIEVMPGAQEIILARVNNQLIKSMKFPPNLGIRIELIERAGGMTRE